jgi:hypothetical protein
MKPKTEKKVVWCVYLDINLDPQWCLAKSREAKALINCPDYVVGYYSGRGDKQAIEDAAATRNGLRQLQAVA